ncbi:MAG: PAS domain-containing protein, partial [Steroidobacteraceae bacterium]
MNTSKSGSNDESSVGHDAADQCRLLLLMDHSLDFIQCLGSNGVILGISSAITSLAGYEPQELVGRPYENLIHPDDCALAAKA